MTYEEIRIALMGRLGSFTGIEQERIDYPNQKSPFKQPKDGAWCRPSIQYGEAFMAGIADKPHTRRPGRLVIQCFDREGNGIGPLSRLADELIEHFAYWSAGHLECLEGSVIDAGRNNGFYQYNVIIRFRAG
ncbi:phage tail terminator-like protein [Paenalcaligenes hominis]|uniref:phage tail terminator-like protein n=1 Tax=Paenalcaligenes hominis TaxID=643674 RepID=UPI003526A9A3